MLLNKSDKIKFKLLYPEHSHDELAVIFNTNRYDIVDTAKSLGIYDPKKSKRKVDDAFIDLQHRVGSRSRF